MTGSRIDSTHSLLERWSKGDEAALAELFPAYFKKVVGLISIGGKPREDVEDAVQAAFMNLHLWLKKGNSHPERSTGFLLVSARRLMRARRLPPKF